MRYFWFIMIGVMWSIHLKAYGVLFPFQIKVWTYITGTSSDKQFIIPTVPGVDYNYTVDCDSGGSMASVSNITGDYTCNYTSTDVYTISISGDFPRIYFNGGGDAKKVLSIERWGDISWTSMAHAFDGTSNMVINASDEPDLSHVSDMMMMFRGASSLNDGLEDWNVSTVTRMSSLFNRATDFNGSIGNWNVSNVTDMNTMFGDASYFNQDIRNWDVSKVTNMSLMFYGTSKFNQDIGDWNVSKVTDMSQMFLYTNSFNQDIGDWDVSKVTSMSQMFNDASLFNQDIGDWDVSKVTDMNNMFLDAPLFNQDIGDWDVSKVTAMSNIFNGAELSTSHYDNLLISWEKIPLENSVSFDSGDSKFCQGESARTAIINKHLWTINGEQNPDCYYHITSPVKHIVVNGTTNVGTVSVNAYSASTDFSIMAHMGDSDLFNINSVSGVLSFKNPPDYKNPQDKNGDNIYRVQVKAHYNSAYEDIQTIRVEVSNVAALVPVISYLLN